LEIRAEEIKRDEWLGRKSSKRQRKEFRRKRNWFWEKKIMRLEGTESERKASEPNLEGTGRQIRGGEKKKTNEEGVKVKSG